MARYYDPGPSCGMTLPPSVIKRANGELIAALCAERHDEALAKKAWQMLHGAPLDEFNQNALERIRRLARDTGEIDLAMAIGAYLDHQAY